ncbi:uncharacterized protein LY89DRAFT_732219 [Mollisia scopiformis]|uniref:Uncharacterized protein n=1 Tax=Mollisia scopiformis TaxID=149040 RepID=A0A194XEU9_MOLSC|nr:uncharacterized protein LY89DRAFT_732219 [Mollisia scopiformis]KUJ18664.1 hypothetical protein LY89DRAFT_732219 [Mollisia scopiformis]
MAAPYERQWITPPKITAPSTPEVEKTVTKPPEPTTSPILPPKTPRKFVPALPSNPRPKRRPSEDLRDPPQDFQAPLPSRAASTAARVETVRRPSILKSPKAARSFNTKSPVSPPPIKLPSPVRRDSRGWQEAVRSPVKVPLPVRKDSLESQNDATSPVQVPSPVRKDSYNSPTKNVESPKSWAPQAVDSPVQSPLNAITPNSQLQEPLYLRVIDIPSSQRSSDTMPVGYSLEATNVANNVLSASPIAMTPGGLLESLGAADASPPSSGDESDPKTPLTPLIEVRPSLQPAPLNLKAQATIETVVIEPSALTPPAKTPSPPPETALPPIPEPRPTQPAHKRALSVKFKAQTTTDPSRRKTSNPSSLGSLAPRSLSTHLLSLGNAPRKLYLATHSPFLRSVSTCKANTALLSQYLARERLYLHSTLRLLSLLLANVILPTRPSGLVSRRRGGIRDKMRQEIEKAERERKAQAQKGQKDFGPGMGANLGVEVASGVANLGMGMVLGGIVGIGTGVGMKTASGSAGVGLSNLGNSATDPPEEEERISEVVENVHRDVGERAVGFLVASIARTRKTLDLFEEVSEDISGIDLDGSEAEHGEGGEMTALTMFTRLFGEIGGAVEKRERSVLAGLVMLFAREKAHLDAWLEVKATLSTRPQTRPASVSISQKRKSEPDRGAIRVYLLPEFTSDESVSYVEELGKLVDDLWADKYIKRDRDSRFLERKDLLEAKKGRMRGGGWEDDIKGLEEFFEMVLDIQGRFWPVC